MPLLTRLDLQSASISITLNLVIRHGYGEAWFSRGYLTYTLGVWLFYLAGLLPDPHAPYSASQVNCHVWVISLGYESIWLFYHLIREPRILNIWNVLQAVLATLRVVAFLVLIVLYLGTGKGKAWEKAAQSRPLQLRAIICFGLLVAQCIINILAPHQLGVVVASLGSGTIPHKNILLYILYRGLQGQQGVIGSVRALLWIPISQSTYRRLSSATFAHVLRLSMDFHISKRVGEVMSALGKGGSLNTFLDGFAFQLFPMVADLWIAAVYFLVQFDAYYSFMVIAITWMYIYITIYMAVYRGRARREMALREREMEASKTDALLSYETVHHSGATLMEIVRYEGVMRPYQRAEYRVLSSLNLLNAVQNGVFTLGTLLLCYLSAYQISIEMQEVPMFVTLLTYLAQLQAPLKFFGSFYTQVQNNLVDAERMLELFDEKPTVTDKPDALPVPQCAGKVSFRNVSFAYSGHTNLSLRNVSFEVAPGSSTAIVGESGSGKSTLLKLLFRFYDVSAGSIVVDDVGVRDVVADDLRSHIGVVPQDIILFNDTISENIRYARPGASEEEIRDICRAASIHDKIVALPLSYATVVGERGLKLSGGERQRVAMARAFLKTPRILLLDEATSSLDSATERLIQKSLEEVARDKTTITIAHRLSTITKADQIIVLEKGQIVEKGNHVELLARNGIYAQMWRKQTQTTGAITTLL
ncbi:putative transport protein [Xylariaceae sp. FL0594]|nr:putative transport protein [Xylariaceae sp. FL0594]